jgi:hypothetical protein
MPTRLYCTRSATWGEGEREFVQEGVRVFHFLEILAGQKDNEKPLTWAELLRVTL